MSDLTTSIKEIFNERISSPFYGSLIVSWLLWNWKIPYVTFIVDQDKLGTIETIKNGVHSTEFIANKIDYILLNCSNIFHLTLFPLLSAIIIIWLLPWVTNKACEVTDIWDKKRIDKRNEIQKKKLLSYEESLRITTEMLSKEAEFAEVLKAKNGEIQTLKAQLNAGLNKPRNNDKKPTQESIYKKEFDEFLKNKEFSQHIESVANNIRSPYGYNVNDSITNYYEAYDIINALGYNKYALTKKGEYFLKEYLKLKINGKIK